VTQTARSDIDRILEAIRGEARARGSQGRIGLAPQEPAAGSTSQPARVEIATHGLPAMEVHHVSDFLCMPIDLFIPQAYERLLGRSPDAGGALHWQRELLRGRLTRAEMLGRLALSPEGRARPSTVAGVLPAAIMAAFYRVPVAGPVLAVLARLLRLPSHLQDRSALEAAALADGRWMKR
jgi:hypothetical protein